MTKLHPIAALLATSALLAPATAFAQAAPPSSPSASQVGDPDDPNQQEDTANAAQPGAADAEPGPGEVEISGPGADRDLGEIVVRGRYIPNPVRATPEVVSVLSAEDIARTGDGDIAGALTRVTGLSVVGGRFVYVRGLGERYSSALLNGAPLPSPEPLRRVVPLDLFPTSIIASTVVQKSYSANYPGEFGGGVINLTTRSAPEEGFFSVGIGGGWDSETTNRLGYTYYGSSTDFLGYDDGNRDPQGAFASALSSGLRIVEGPDFEIDQIKSITQSLDNASTNLIQRNDNLPANWSGDIGFGTTIPVGAADLGIIGVAGISNSWRTRAGIQQAGTRVGSLDADDSYLDPFESYRYVSTENRVVVNGMLSTTLKLDDHKFRVTGLYIRDALKGADVKIGNSFDTVDASLVRPEDTLQTGETSYFERELYDAQAVAELEFGDLSLDLRGSYAKTRRDAPYERGYSYYFDDTLEDYVNDLRSPGQGATVAFSELDDELWSGAIDLSYKLPTGMPITASAGYAYSDNTRSALRRSFAFRPTGTLPSYVAQERIDYLLSDFNVATFDILLQETTGALGAAAYDAGLTVHGAYGMLEIEPTNEILVNLGVRYEEGTQNLTPQALFGNTPLPETTLKNDYWLPAGTVTWNFADDMQLRLGASKTIARPQFRELAPQPFRDYESARLFYGNQYLVDSEILNVDLRYEYYFGRDQIVSAALFYKDIDKPIETVAANVGSSQITSFINAPSAQLYGAELELRKYLPFYDLGAQEGFLSARRLVFIGNYTYTNSELKVADGDTTITLTSAPFETDATNIFRDGARLTGQSEHLVNLQFGLEHEDRLSQQTFLLTYASDRATNRGANQTPDLIEEPGVMLDFIWREGFELLGTELELKGEVRNILGTDYKETQSLNDSMIVIQSYDRGTRFNLSATVKF
ncbi:TonB-dependent receptor domain-containing protein [Sphingomicrobium nitratireducens]|uniref:TonB-dependent receptor domain-containing protein n=1 Tax=Sphingomicrobium nitratireducens TaxID=2964666 RepID=UPI00223F412C|nr:TonB-dependent receptor [Sphingomicrobium nitratireducens]